MGTKLNFSTTFQPQTDGQTERVNQILEDLLRLCAIDFPGSWDEHLPLAEFSYNNSYQDSLKMAPFEALYGRRCRTPAYWAEAGERAIIGSDLLQEMEDNVKKIRSRLKTAQDRQEKYANPKRRLVNFNVGDEVLLRVSPMRGVQRFGVKGKLAPRFVGPFLITEKVGERAYRLQLPNSLSQVHNVFHVSQLRKFLRDPRRVISVEPLDLQQDLTYEEQPVEILDYSEKKLRNKIVPLVKVLWRNHEVEEATWELESEMRDKYPYLF